MGLTRTRVFSLILLICIILSAFTFISADENAKASLVLSKANAIKGEIIEVSLYLDNTNKLSVLELNIPIDKESFSYVEDSLVTKFDYGNSLITKGYRESKEDIYFSYVDSINPKIVNALVFTFKLKILKNGYFKLTIDDLLMADKDINPLACTKESANILVSLYTLNEEKMILSKIPKETSYKHFKLNALDIIVYRDDNEIKDDDYLGTGMQALIGDKEYQIVVTGDVNGDGKINVTDLLLIRSHILSKIDLEDIYLLGADTNNDGKVNVTDLLQVRADILRKFTIEAY